MAILQKKTQGISGEWNYRKQLVEMFELDNINEVTLATAFLNENGVELISEELLKVASHVTAYVGVRNAVTTFQGIMALIDLGVKVYAVDCGGPMKIYHEKTYMVKNDFKAMFLTGSGNLTRGGLVTNIESGTIINCDLSIESDKGFFDSCKEQLQALVDDFSENVYLVEDVSKALLLKENGILLDESKSIPRKVSGISKTDKATFEVPAIKTFVEKVKKEKTVQIKKDEMEITVPKSEELDSALLRYVEIWKSKELKERDLNVPTGEGTNVTGSMLLKKGQYEINQQTYFYEEAFKELNWKRGSGKQNKFLYAEAHFDFLIDGVFIEGDKLTLKHDPRTDTATFLQKQPMTHLLWGKTKKLVAKTHLLGEIMTIYKNKEKTDSYLIQIQEEI